MVATIASDEESVVSSSTKSEVSEQEEDNEDNNNDEAHKKHDHRNNKDDQDSSDTSNSEEGKQVEDNNDNDDVSHSLNVINPPDDNYVIPLDEEDKGAVQLFYEDQTHLKPALKKSSSFLFFLFFGRTILPF